MTLPADSTDSAQQKVWLVTGTSSGFGKRLVKSIVLRGDYVLATVRRLQDFQVDLTNEERSHVHVLVLDLTDTADVIQQKAIKALEIWGRVDILVNNAGVAPKALLEEAGTSFIMSQFQSNLFAVMYLTNALLPQMRERRSGTIVFMGSRSVWKPDTPMTGNYIATKAAIHALGETYACELAQFNVRVMIVCPGGFRTEKIHLAPLTIDHRIPAYDAYRDEEFEKFHDRWRNATGDPVKAVELVVDVVKGEGKAQGRDLPLYLLLGSPTYDAARTHCNTLLKSMEVWEDIAKDLDLEPATN